MMMTTPERKRQFQRKARKMRLDGLISGQISPAEPNRTDRQLADKSDTEYLINVGLASFVTRGEPIIASFPDAAGKSDMLDLLDALSPDDDNDED